MKKSMRKKITFRLSAVMTALVMVIAFGVVDGVQAIGADGAVKAQAVSTSSKVKAGQNTVLLTGCIKGKEYVLSVVKGSYSKYSINENTVLYIDQKKAEDTNLEFTFSVSTGERCVVLVSSNDGASAYPLIIGEFNIPVSEAAITLAAKTYNGKVQAATASTIKYRNTALKSGTDYTISGSGTKAGTYTAKITGKGSFTGTVSKSFKINPLALSKTTITVKARTYNGKSQVPAVTIRYGGKTLVKGTDFTLSGSGKKVGTYTAKLTGKGNFNGTVSKYFKIIPVGTSLKSLTKGKRKITVKWNKPAAKYKTQMTGYQIQYSLYSNFKSAKSVKIGKYGTTSKVLTGLKAKKKYYVRIRTYKGSCYSSWSKSRYTTTK